MVVKQGSLEAEALKFVTTAAEGFQLAERGKVAVCLRHMVTDDGLSHLASWRWSEKKHVVPLRGFYFVFFHVKIPISFWQNRCYGCIHNKFLNGGICLQHEAAKVRFIWRFILNLGHPASLLGQVAVKSWNPQRLKTDWKFLLMEFGKMVEQDSEVESDPTSCHLWLILLRYEAQMFG